MVKEFSLIRNLGISFIKAVSKKAKKHGWGASYHDTGLKKYEGFRNMQMREGDGTLYDDKGNKIY